MDTIVNTVQGMAETADESGRKHLIDSLNKLVLSIEKPQDLMQRLLYLHVYISVARVACDLKLFSHIVDNGSAMTAQEAAQKSGAAPELIANMAARLLRYLASVGALDEIARDTYAANAATRTMAQPAWQAAIYHNFDFAWPCFLAMPDFLKETGYKDVQDPRNCPFNKGHNTDVAAFDWFPKQEWLFSNFNQYMTIQRDGMPTWLDVYPFMEKAAGLGPQQPLFVDIGGGVGHQSIALRDALPKEITNKIIVQDQAPVIARSIQKAGIESVVHNFWQPQPVKGARIYYMRNIIHDWPDHESLELLKLTKAAMGPDSVLLIDDMVVPDTGAHWQATQLDMLMMSALASRERTRAQWNNLIPKAGLRINNVYQYTISLNDCIIECVPALD
ncbi:hypothetical protein QQS21_006783 [Conoideocrella luteorostrata]|uniref:O-methyltransferase n=1 Tax=Conoideocrella luteorostrata TaxID=1105319 RepID=A0AAJ0CLZ6_9HYPO|nr:hypothetical protein QQS21_006783 [Conoideocrella luteorostrata]